ncbi:LytR/AlgR family response regulator transcription factor [Lutibacter sp.]
MKSKKNKILIVEDEPIIASDIEMILENLDYEVTGIEDNAEGTLTSISKNPPDLVLLDINLDGDIDGVLLAENINKQFQIPFIFLTSNADKLTINRVKRTQPAGFIVKPFCEKDLQSNIEIALFSKREKKHSSNKKITDFFVKSGGSLIKITVDEILFIQADDNYSRIFTTKKNHILTSTLKKVNEKLPSFNFIRIHRSYIVNCQFINEIKEGFLHIGKHKLPIGRSYQEILFQKISKL